MGDGEAGRLHSRHCRPTGDRSGASQGSRRHLAELDGEPVCEATGRVISPTVWSTEMIEPGTIKGREIRCAICKKLLGKVCGSDYRLEIMCPRCKKLKEEVTVRMI